MRSPGPSTRAWALLLLTTVAAACGGPAPPRPSRPGPTPGSPATLVTTPVTVSPVPSPAAPEPRPLRLPVVRAGAACPMTSPRPWSGPGEASRVLGDGPVYPIADYFRDGAVLRLRPDDREPDGSYVKKVRWVVADYTGPVLIRVARIDGKGTASARFSYTGERRDGGYHAELTMPGISVPGTTTVGGPGCYAYQIDGTTFSTVVVFGAVTTGAADE